MDLIIVGSDSFDLTIARQVAEAGRTVIALERHDHIGGSAWSSINSETGIEMCRYGTCPSHISNERVWAYASHSTSFNSYQRCVYMNRGGVVYLPPTNPGTINQFFASTYTPGEAHTLIAEQATELGDTEPANLEEKAVSLIGRPLYEAFIKDYMHKQQQTDPKDLNASIIPQPPVRFAYDSRYSRDAHEGLPLDGYAAWLERFTGHENIEVLTGHNLLDETYPCSRSRVVGRTSIVCTGALDRHFDYELGSSTWRTLDFESEVVDTPGFQGCSITNYSDESVPFTRIHELAHLHPERERTGARNTSIMYELSRFAQAGDEPYYPVGRLADRKTLVVYRDLAAGEDKVAFDGRLGSYKYLDMHIAIGSVLNHFGETVPI